MSTKLPAKSSTMFRDPGRTRYSIHAQEELEGPAKVCSPRSKLRWRSLTFSQLGVSKPDQYDGLHIKIRGLYWQYLPSPMVSLEWTNPPMVVVGGALNEDLLEESEARQHELSHKQCPGERSQPAQHLLCPGFVWKSRGTASIFQWFSIMFGNGHEWGYTTVVVTIINTSTSPFSDTAIRTWLCLWFDGHVQALFEDPIQKGPHQNREFLQEGLDEWRIARDCYLLYEWWPMR